MKHVPHVWHTRFEHFIINGDHNITHLLVCVLWDQVSHEHNSPLTLRSLVYGGTLKLCTVNFSTNNYKLSEYFIAIYLICPPKSPHHNNFNFSSLNKVRKERELEFLTFIHLDGKHSLP